MKKYFGLLLILGIVGLVVLTFLVLPHFNTFSLKGSVQFNDLNSYQKQKYWQLMRSCQVFLLDKQNSKYRSCALDAMKSAKETKEASAYCNDSDGVDYFNKGKVTSDLYPNGIDDYLNTFSNGQKYLMEGTCNFDKQYAVYQKNCKEFGENYDFGDNVCVLTTTKLDQLINEPVPESWIKQFNKDFLITFENNPGYPEFTDDQKEIIKNSTYKSFYVASKIDGYFKKPLPWTGGKKLYDWFKSSIVGINYFNNDDSNHCCALPPNVFVGSSDKAAMIHIRGPQVLENIDSGFSKQWYQPSVGFDDLFISIYIHEARHANPDAGVHVSCFGDVGNDKDLKSMGGRGVQFFFRHWLRYMLPNDMTDEILKKYGNGAFDVYGKLISLCTFDKKSLILEKEDNDWLESVSGHKTYCTGILNCI